MQKILTYLYPNTINVVADLAIFPVRWNIVYQNRVKIYQGVDNLLTIDVKNADQKRIDISEMTLEMSITDVNGQALTKLPLTSTATTGLATVNIPLDILENLNPQFLNFTIYRLNDDNTKTLMYTDTQFGAKGNIELVGSAVPTNPPPRYITRFNLLTNTSVTPYQPVYYSDAVDITKPNFLKPEPNEALSFDFDTTLLQAEVTIEFTKDTVIGAATNWETIETITIPLNSTLTNRIYFYPTVNREYTWARVKYIKQSTNGKFNSVTVTFETIDESFLIGGNAINNTDLTVDGGWSTT